MVAVVTRSRSTFACCSRGQGGVVGWCSAGGHLTISLRLGLCLLLAAVQYFLWRGEAGDRWVLSPPRVINNLQGSPSPENPNLFFELTDPRKRFYFQPPLPPMHSASSSSNNNNDIKRLSLDDLPDLKNDTIFQRHYRRHSSSKNTKSRQSLWKAAQKRLPFLNMLQQAGILIENDVLEALPTWSETTALYGPKPVVIGMERCAAFRNQAPAETRYVGVAGQMNSGTTALGKYLLRNLIIEENPKRSGGIIPGIPWSKHGWASLRDSGLFPFVTDMSHLLPVVIIRDPYFWMRSMCQSPYNLQWSKTEGRCPNLVRSTSSIAAAANASNGVPVQIKWNNIPLRKWHSLAHVWSSWYKEYLEADFPRLIIRFEDLLLDPAAILIQIKECLGASWRNKDGGFEFVTETVKNSTYFRKYKEQSGLLSGIIKYGRDNGRRTYSMDAADLEYAKHFIDSDLMKIFHYQQPLKVVDYQKR